MDALFQSQRVVIQPCSLFRQGIFVLLTWGEGCRPGPIHAEWMYSVPGQRSFNKTEEKLNDPATVGAVGKSTGSDSRSLKKQQGDGAADRAIAPSGRDHMP